MQTRATADAIRYRRMTTQEIRESFLIENLFRPGELQLVYIDVERAIVGSAVPTIMPLALTSSKELASEFFAQRRELGVINIGAPGSIAVDGKTHPMANRDCLYIGRGSRTIEFSSADERDPARFYILSYPAGADHPTKRAAIADVKPVKAGSPATASERTVYKFIYPAGIQSCQLVMGITQLAEGSVWTTMPAHTHERRSEVYCYFDLPENAAVFHIMGRPDETRLITVRNLQAVIYPSWSIHSGVGTSNYTFIWGMGGENQDFDNMDLIKIEDLK